MTLGIGGSTAEIELSKLSSMRDGIKPIADSEFHSRIAKLARLMTESDVDACYLDASSSLAYFTGLVLRSSERLHAAIITKTGELYYVVPAFEEQAIRAILRIEAPFYCWQEENNPTDLVISSLSSRFDGNLCLALDEMTPFFTADGLKKSAPNYNITNAAPLTSSCRMEKSEAEIALMQRANDMTIEVHKATARILSEGCCSTDIKNFIDQAHIKVGADGPSTFKIVLFGEASAYPHGVPHPLYLKDGDTVLIDTGTTVEGYNSDITRTYVFGEPSDHQRQIWAIERAAQDAAFSAAVLGDACGNVDQAARKVVVDSGMGPGYQLPGLPHRTGHGIGIDVHEYPYMVKDNIQILKQGMCFSIEPMICIYGSFGVRLEDLAYMDKDGPRWFSQPAYSIDDPFGYEVG